MKTLCPALGPQLPSFYTTFCHEDRIVHLEMAQGYCITQHRLDATNLACLTLLHCIISLAEQQICVILDVAHIFFKCFCISVSISSPHSYLYCDNA